MAQFVRNEKMRRMDIDKIIAKQINPEDFTPLNIYEIRNYCYFGFSENTLRPKYWKVLLGYFSKNKFNSANYYKNKRNAYLEYVKGIKEHESEHSTAFKVITDDLNRTIFNPLGEGGKQTKPPYLERTAINSLLTNKQVLERILKCYVVHNRSIGYIQGMNMLLLHLYYVMASSEDIEDRLNSEADTFYCFVSFMSGLFEQIISNVEEGGDSMKVILNKIYGIIETVDQDLYTTCLKKKMFESGIVIRWIMFVFCIDYRVESILWLWDRLLSDKNRFEMVYYCAAAIFIVLKDVICNEERETALEALQKPSLIDVQTIFNAADAMRLQVRGKIIRET